MFSIFAFMLLSVTVKAQSIVGVWLREDGSIMRISSTQHKNVFTFSFDGDLKQTTRLMAKGNGLYTGILERVNNQDGCTTYLPMSLQINSSRELTMSEHGGDGNCDVPADHQATLSATKKR